MKRLLEILEVYSSNRLAVGAVKKWCVIIFKYVNDGLSKGATSNSFRRNQRKKNITGTIKTRMALRISFFHRKNSVILARSENPISRVSNPHVSARIRQRKMDNRESFPLTIFSVKPNERIKNIAKGTSERISVENNKNNGLIMRNKHPIN